MFKIESEKNLTSTAYTAIISAVKYKLFTTRLFKINCFLSALMALETFHRSQSYPRPYFPKSLLSLGICLWVEHLTENSFGIQLCFYILIPHVRFF
jgi:hypothetical protein